MTEAEKKELERRIAIEQYALNGGNIEALSKIYPENGWFTRRGIEFLWKEFDYRIAEPVKKKIKLEAWLDNETGSLGHYVEDCSGVEAPRFTRLPYLDIETEVTE